MGAPNAFLLSALLAFLYYRFGGWRSAHMGPVTT
jgi:hypothetical protein